MHFFTIVQFCGLALLWGVKSWKDIALAFPFFVLLMVPLRMTLPYLPWIFKFTQAELDAVSSFFFKSYVLMFLILRILIRIKLNGEVCELSEIFLLHGWNRAFD